MKSGSVFSFMKRFLLLSVLFLVMGQTAFGYLNNGVLQVPPMSRDLLPIDDPIFINNGTFSVNLTPDNLPGSSTVPFEMSDTVHYTNNGTMTGVPGFDLENFPASVGQAHMSDSFTNNANGPGHGEIYCTNIYGGLNVFQLTGLFGGF